MVPKRYSENAELACIDTIKLGSIEIAAWSDHKGISALNQIDRNDGSKVLHSALFGKSNYKHLHICLSSDSQYLYIRAYRKFLFVFNKYD
jgi:hypothetical protein